MFDPGVLVAAALTPGGVCGQALRTVLDQRCVMIVCPALLAEREEVLLRPKFRRYLDVDQAQNCVALVGRIGERHPDPVVPPGLTADPDDEYLVALTRAAGADYPISGDPHLTGLTGIDFPVLSPRAFLERLG